MLRDETCAATRVEGGNLDSTSSDAAIGDMRGLVALSSSFVPRYADKHMQTVSYGSMGSKRERMRLGVMAVHDTMKTEYLQ